MKGTAGISRKCWLCLKNNAAQQTHSVGERRQREITCCSFVFPSAEAAAGFRVVERPSQSPDLHPAEHL